MSEKSNIVNMNKSFLENLPKSKLIKLLLKLNAIKPIKIDTSVPKPRRPAPTPQFRDDYKPIPAPRTKKPSEKRTIISQVEKALKGYTKSFDVELRDNKDPLLQLQKSRRAVEYLFNNLLVQTKGFKFVETLQVKFVKYSNDKKIQKNGYFNSTTDLIINETDIKLAIQTSQ